MSSSADPHAARLTIDYPDRDLDRVSTALRLVYAIPVLIVLGTVAGTVGGDTAGETGGRMGGFGGVVLVLPVLLMIVFRNKYPRWWFDFNQQLARFSTRVLAYLALMSDRYPSTDEEQSVHLDLDYRSWPPTSTAGFHRSSGCWPCRTTSFCSSWGSLP
jgi:hypothetical protein